MRNLVKNSWLFLLFVSGNCFSQPDVTFSGAANPSSGIITVGGFIDYVFVVRNIGNAQTSGSILMSVPQPSVSSGITIAEFTGPVNLGLPFGTITPDHTNWVYSGGILTYTGPPLQPGGGSSTSVALRATRTAGSNGLLNFTASLQSGTGGEPTTGFPAANNSLNFVVQKQ